MARYISLDGNTYLSTPSAVLSNNDLDLRAKVAATDWTSLQAVLAKYSTVGANRSFLPVILAGGELQLYWSEDGTTAISQASSAVTGIADGDAAEIRYTLDVDNGAGGYDIKFYVDGTQLGSTRTGGATTSVVAGSATLTVGVRSDGVTFPFTGDVYWAEVRDGVGGAVAVRADADDAYAAHGYGALANGATWVGSVDGLTWTVNGTGAVVVGGGGSFNQSIAGPGQLLQTGG